MLSDFGDHDLAAFARLTPAQRAEQRAARWLLYEYIDGIWEGAKRRGLNPANLPECDSVAAMRDLAPARDAAAVA